MAATYLLSHFYGVSTPAREQNAVTRLNAEADVLALFIGQPRTDSNYSCLWKSSRGRRGGQEKTRGSFLRHDSTSAGRVERMERQTNCFWLEALNKDTVKERKHAFDRFERGSLQGTTSRPITMSKDVCEPFYVCGKIRWGRERQ